ncbi:MAG: BspA family leucine-rich repeat surface protein [Acetatifactor sp.]
MKRKVIKSFVFGVALLLSAQMPKMSVQAAGECVQENIVEAEQYDAVTVTSGNFGVFNGLHWVMDPETGTVTISGKDMPYVRLMQNGNTLANSVFPAATKKIQFSDCTIVDNMTNLFAFLTELEEIDFSGLVTENLTNMDCTFNGCDSIKSLVLKNIDSSKVTSMSTMFCCDNLEIVDLSTLDTSSVEDMNSMFTGCHSLKSLDLKTFDTGKVTDMSDMFYECGMLETLNLEGWTNTNVEDMSEMFGYCCSLKNLNLTNFGTKNTTNMYYMFSECSALENLDLSSFETAKVENMAGMFSGCKSLKKLDISNFQTTSPQSLRSMLNNCSELVCLKTPKMMGENTVDLPGTFVTEDGRTTNIVSEEYAGMTLYREGYLSGKPIISTQPVSVKVNDGTQATFTVAATGDGLTYQWELSYAGDSTFRNCTFTGADTDTLTVDAIKARNGYSFRCIITDENGQSVISDIAKLTVETEEALDVSLTASKTKAEVGDIVRFTAQCSGGDGDYVYKFSLNYVENDTWHVLQPARNNNSIQMKVTKELSIRIRVDVWDGSGKTASKEIIIVVGDEVVPVELTANLAASTYEANSGEIVTFTAQGNGGDGDYQYKFIINDTANDNWYKLQDYSANNTIQWKATTAGTKRIMVDIKDGTGTIVGKNVSVVVNGTIAPTELKATLNASSYEVQSGDMVTLTAQGMGGSGKYNYKFIINDKTDDKWYKLQDFGTNNVIQWKATTPGTKRLMVDVMDSAGKKFGINVTIFVK